LFGNNNGYQTFSGDVGIAGPTHLPNTMSVRLENSAPDGDKIKPRGELTFDFPMTLERTDNSHWSMTAKPFTVPAHGSRVLRQSFGIGTTEAGIASMATSQRIRINPYRPDGWIKKSGGTFLGKNVYNTSGAGQTAGGATTYIIAIQNDGTRTDSFRIHGAGPAGGFGVRYLAGLSGSTSITSKVEQGTFAIHDLPPGAVKYIRLLITLPKTANGQHGVWPVYLTSLTDATRKDVVRATVQMAIS